VDVLVCAASRYGATAEIAGAVATTLDDAGLGVTVCDPSLVSTLEGYDAVVIGSAVYAGRWLTSAKELVARLAGELRERPVWLFSSGPLGDPLKPEGEPVDAEPMVAATRARDHRVFAGRLDRSRLSLPERAVVVALRAPEGDFRDWDEVRSWAADIAATLVLESSRP
jgi:menaquinone-dependent protoporphyrinogen oxidase